MTPSNKIDVRPLLVAQIKLEEDWRASKYRDNSKAKHWTIGWGHNLDIEPEWPKGNVIPATIDKAFGEILLQHDIEEGILELTRRWPRFREISEARQDACINMCFQIGVSGFLKFEVLRAALIARDHRGAYNAALNSLWARQTPARAKRVATQFLTGIHYTKK